MRILMVHNRYLQPGGEEECVRLEAEMLTRRGHKVIRYEEDNQRIEELGLLRTGFRTTWSTETFRRVRDVIREQRPDVVHVHGYFPLISPAVHWAARAEAVATVQTVHNYRISCANAFMLRDGKPCEECVGRLIALPAVRYRCYRRSRLASSAIVAAQAVHNLLGTWTRVVDAFICPSSFVQRKMLEAGLPASRLHVKPHFLWPDPGLGGGGDAFVFVGRLSPEKGVATLLDAWLAIDDPPELRIIGDGPMSDAVLRAVDAMPVIHWVGRRPLEQVLAILKRSRALVAPSETYETFGRAGAEAMAVGTPVIGANIGAVAEMVRPGVNGLLFEPGDATGLANCVHEMRRSPMGKFRAAARRTFEDYFTEDRNYRSLMGIYDGAIETARERGASR